MVDISIIVPVYNVESYLDYCINSLLTQSFTGEYEIICINDGSTDCSLQILREYERKNPNILVIDKVNSGLSSARNLGIKNSSGDYVMFLDSDDYLNNTDVLLLMFNEVKEHDLDFVVADFEYDYTDKSKNYRIKRDKSIMSKVMRGKDIYDIGYKTKSITSVVWNKLYKRKFILDNSLYFVEGIIYEDMEFTPRAYYLANKVKYIDVVAVKYRQREGSITSMGEIQWEKSLGDYLVIADKLNQFNKSFKSEMILRTELFEYVKIIRKIRHIGNKAVKNEYRAKLYMRNVPYKFIKSKHFKYKVFGILFALHIL